MRKLCWKNRGQNGAKEFFDRVSVPLNPVLPLITSEQIVNPCSVVAADSSPDRSFPFGAQCPYLVTILVAILDNHALHIKLLARTRRSFLFEFLD